MRDVGSFWGAVGATLGLEDVVIQTKRPRLKNETTLTAHLVAESIIGLYKTELIRMRGPWKHLDDVEYATLEWVDWFNHRRLFEPIGNMPPAELEANHHRRNSPARGAGLTQPSLH